jgi:alpha-beta hydrolase superfamily lysophospholipase
VVPGSVVEVVEVVEVLEVVVDVVAADVVPGPDAPVAVVGAGEGGGVVGAVVAGVAPGIPSPGKKLNATAASTGFGL